MNRDFILHVNSCHTPHEQIHNASILFRGGQIIAVGGFSALRVLDDIPCIDLPHGHAIPGLIDTHLHGSGGFAAMDADAEHSLDDISLTLAMHGVTSFVLTVLSAPAPKMLAVIDALARECGTELPGAQLVGLHIEGPYLNMQKRGAQAAEGLRPIDLGETEELLSAGGPAIKTMTFAPELEGSCQLVDALLAHGVTPSMGHSLAGAEETQRAIDAGARRCTHLFNGMPPLDQRNVGLTSLGLTDDRLTIELIVDGVHVHPQMIDLACRAKPAANVISISDATQGAGLREGIYHLGQSEIVVADGASRLKADGRLAGSSMTLDRGLANLLAFSSLSTANAVACHTSNPARSIGLTDRGEIRPGRRGDVVVVDENWQILLTIVNGCIVYDRNNCARN